MGFNPTYRHEFDPHENIFQGYSNYDEVFNRSKIVIKMGLFTYIMLSSLKMARAEMEVVFNVETKQETTT